MPIDAPGGGGVSGGTTEFMKTAVTQATPNSGPDQAIHTDQAIHEVARGGALNLVGNAVYGFGNFLLLGIVTTQLGANGAGVFLVAIALFNILSKVCEFGAATGLIRTISRDRALGKQHELPRQHARCGGDVVRRVGGRGRGARTCSRRARRHLRER